MENKISLSRLRELHVFDLLDLIAGCDAVIERMLKVGMNPDSSSVRQELHLKHKYCEELTSVFHSLNVQIRIVEDELRQAA
jgi:hypothetical protein